MDAVVGGNLYCESCLHQEQAITYLPPQCMSQFHEPEQMEFRLADHSEVTNLEVLDLFAGIGGISLGFRAGGFSVTGVDHETVSQEVFRINGIGDAVHRDLLKEMEIRSVPVVVGGPPCRPWSAVNVVRRGQHHEDYDLLDRFLAHLLEIRPAVFLMENVPALGSDPEFHRLLRELRWSGYSLASSVLQYSDFGAATRRRRLFTAGFRNSVRWSAEEFFRRLTSRHRPWQPVRGAIEWLRDKPRGSVPDHEWSVVHTIGKYHERYRTGQYGWRQLGWGEPAPSFGSVAKTYVLHPSAGEQGFPPRVLSVREVLSIMGFDREFRFPDTTSLTKRYRMAANAVSPIASEACARIIREMLTGQPTD
jgi:DNA (cytosine-5)-methyltransferase 1